MMYKYEFMVVKTTFLVNLQDLFRFRMTVGSSICFNMLFISLCRLVEKHKEFILIHGTMMMNNSSRLYLVRCSTSNELMRPLSFVWSVGHLKMGDGGDCGYYWIVRRGMKTTNLVVCLSLIGVIAEPAHNFNICVVSEGEKGKEKDTGQ